MHNSGKKKSPNFHEIKLTVFVFQKKDVEEVQSLVRNGWPVLCSLY